MFTTAFGHLTYDAASVGVNPDTIYDVASLTKSIPTACLAMGLVENGQITLTDKVSTYLPELQNSYRDEIMIKHLLTYTLKFNLPQGLSALAAQYGPNLLNELFKTPLLQPPGSGYQYANAPAILLGLIAERVGGSSLSDQARSVYFEPLGMRDTTFHTEDWVTGRVAPTEIFDGQEVRGIVHDEAARALSGAGITPGCAGLFSTVTDLLIFSKMLLGHGQLDRQRYLSVETIDTMRQNQLKNINAIAGLGWEIYRPDVMGRAQRPGLMMKSGFTGCWIAIDIDNQSALVLLSNRTYPRRPERAPFNTFLRELNEAFWL